MLTKAILTGGVLSVLAGSIVYFGTEGADALERDVQEEVRLEETELAGGLDADDTESAGVQMVVEANDPPKDKPKTRWLDQYLKKSKSKSEGKDLEVASDPAPEVDVDIDVDIEEDVAAESAEIEKKEKARVKTRIRKNGGDDMAKGTYIVTEGSRVETIDVDELDLESLDLDGDIDVEKLKSQLGIEGEKNIEVRVIKKKMSGVPSRFTPGAENDPPVKYDLVLNEAKKLLVTDMRNQAVLEIVDYAIDNGDMADAADLVEELSTPELRDTARARIGTGLARNGKADAAFAVLNELEIDELAAPIRLEIITALMATRQERDGRRSVR